MHIIIYSESPPAVRVISPGVGAHPAGLAAAATYNAEERKRKTSPLLSTHSSSPVPEVQTSDS